MIDDNKVEAERQELNLLINKGLTFEVDRTIYVRKEGISGYFKKRTAKTEKLKFTVQEPTLSTLDRMSAEQLELRIDENVMSTDKGLQEAKKMVHEHGRRMARIIAIAVVGSDSMQAIGGKYITNDSRIGELTELFYTSIQPSKLLQLTLLVNTMSNLGDFINSIRLMSAARTTKPIRIEQEKG